MKRALVSWAIVGEKGGRARPTLHRATAEIFGARVMKQLGIGAPEVELLPRNIAAQSPNWLHKFTVDDRVLVVKKILGAISLHYLALLHSVKSEPSVWVTEPPEDGGLLEQVIGFDETPSSSSRVGTPGVRGLHLNIMRTLLDRGKANQVKNPVIFHRDFSLPEDVSGIRRAIAWDSEQRLAIHAARLLIGCSAAHGGNILVDSGAKLFSIDHETCTFSDTSGDVEVLAEYIRRPSRAYSVVRRVANQISTHDMDSLFDGLPDLPWPFGTKGATVSFFKQRIRLFQKTFPA